MDPPGGPPHNNPLRPPFNAGHTHNDKGINNFQQPNPDPFGGGSLVGPGQIDDIYRQGQGQPPLGGGGMGGFPPAPGFGPGMPQPRYDPPHPLPGLGEPDNDHEQPPLPTNPNVKDPKDPKFYQ